jgi:hypothetical protein
MLTVYRPPVLTVPKNRVIFLAGPIQGAPDWQARAIDNLGYSSAVFDIASPRRLEMQKLTLEELTQQYAWEHYYLERAATEGVVLFWLAKEEFSVPGRAYAQTTRFELGEHAALQSVGRCTMVVGIEPGFTNERYLRYTLSTKMPGIPIYDNLAQTCEAAANKMPIEK